MNTINFIKWPSDTEKLNLGTSIKTLFVFPNVLIWHKTINVLLLQEFPSIRQLKSSTSKIEHFSMQKNLFNNECYIDSQPLTLPKLIFKPLSLKQIFRFWNTPPRNGNTTSKSSKLSQNSHNQSVFVKAIL